MTSHRIGVNLRVSGNCDQGARKYMEDNHVIKFLKKDTDDYEFAYFGVFDGHGGPEASIFCRDNLLNEITKYDGFWTNDDEQVMSAIKKGFLDTHNAMWSVIDTWPKTLTGLPSTSGSTSTIAIVKQGKLYTGHVGDSGLVLGENDVYSSNEKFPVQAICITKDHKPDDPDERMRIEDAGGEVINKSGVPRVVWSRPKTNHKGPVRRSTQIDQIPFLAVARSLGDLWSYDYYTETYVVSPDPDVSVITLDPSKHRCLILASDGLWNMLTAEESVNMVMDLEAQFEQKIINDPNVAVTFWSNPAERLVARALNKWRAKALKADNTSCVVVLIDPLGPSKLTLLKRKRQELLSAGEVMPTDTHKHPSTQFPTEFDHRSKSSVNYNANCSISDSHIRLNDESIIRPLKEKSITEPFVPTTDCPSEAGVGRQRLFEDYNDSINDTLQFSAVDSTRKDDDEDADRQNQPTNSRPPPHGAVSPSEAFHLKKSTHDPTRITSKLEFNNSVTRSDSSFSAGDRFRASLREKSHPFAVSKSEHRGGKSRQEYFEEDEDIDVEEAPGGLSDISEEMSIPQPPPSTPCTSVGDCGDENDDENSLHSSADVTDLAFSLASDESLESPGVSFDKNRPVTPRSAPAKLRGTRASKNKSRPKGGKSLFSETDNSQTLSGKPPPFVNPNHNTTASVKAQGDSTKQAIPANCASKSVGTSAYSDVGTGENFKKDFSSPKRVLNTSRSMNDVITPKLRPESSEAPITCTGLTPNMNMLMTHKDKVTSDKCTGTNTDIDVHNLYSFMVMDKAKFKAAQTLKTHEDNNASMVMDDPDLPMSQTMMSHADPLKQLNKTGGLRKVGSKRFGNFLRTSKLNLDNVFHIGTHRKGKKSSSSHSTGKLEQIQRQQQQQSSKAYVKNTSMSTSGLADFTQSHLPDITLSHYADVTLDASSLTAGDLTNLSALSADDSMLSAIVLNDKIHHSLIEEGPVGKGGKNKKGFLQKTRFTLQRARKAAKKAFFPENHRLFQQKAAGMKRKSDEFLPTPEMKRRKHLKSEKC